MKAERIDVLAVMDAVANGIHSPNEGEVSIAHHTLHDFLEARAAVAEAVSDLQVVANTYAETDEGAWMASIVLIALARIGAQP